MTHHAGTPRHTQQIASITLPVTRVKINVTMRGERDDISALSPDIVALIELYKARLERAIADERVAELEQWNA